MGGGGTGQEMTGDGTPPSCPRWPVLASQLQEKRLTTACPGGPRNKREYFRKVSQGSGAKETKYFNAKTVKGKKS